MGAFGISKLDENADHSLPSEVSTDAQRALFSYRRKSGEPLRMPKPVQE